MALYPLIRPALFALDAERAHRLTIAALKAAPNTRPPPAPPSLAVELAGIAFPNPVGLAAGFDKDAEVADAVLGLGFGFTEIGTVTPLQQSGNPKPRLFRLAEDEAVINRMGFNNSGQVAVRDRLTMRDRARGIVGVNIGANKDSADRINDYERGARLMAPVADYLTVNVSSPNTPGLRDLQDGEALDELLGRVMAARHRDDDEDFRPSPVFLKVAPDLDNPEIDAIARAAIEHGVAALIIGNTTLSRPPLHSRHRDQTGGLSGKPLAPLALEKLRAFRSASGGALPLIAAGGIDTADEAWTRIRAGASLVQLYSALVYHGPGLARRIVKDLATHCKAEGMVNIAEAVGSE